ncbi:MAG: family 20 glycosylhydrolase [Kiritimatiellae bacterium]|nr:family 20 glycosylhydrolase [Kiritimatiellia bacterium]
MDLPLFSQKEPVIKRRGIHLDLKGLPPTPQRLLRLLEVFATARYNVVLVEWEDTFPWTVDERFRSETAYSPSTVEQFASAAERLGIEIIPLVQCLGHMETPLSVCGYEHLREVPDRPDGLNPLAPGARELVERMVDDVLRALPNVKHFHLGGDEAWTFGMHPDTRRFISEHGKEALYLLHVEPLLDKLGTAGIRPILWHDMMRDWSADALRRLGEKTDLMVWGYRGHPDTTQHHFSSRVIERFLGCGVGLWGATAYKGADGQDADLPDIVQRLENARAWTDVAQRYGFKGVVATAWSRYSTHLMQTEPIDAALDSAVNVGAIFYDGTTVRPKLDACVKLLDEIGEGDRFRSCRGCMERLSALRMAAWDKVRILRELIHTIRTDGRRLPCFRFVEGVKDLRTRLGEADKLEKEVCAAFEGLVPHVWIERYLAERLEPLRDELKEIETAARAVGIFLN